MSAEPTDYNIFRADYIRPYEFYRTFSSNTVVLQQAENACCFFIFKKYVTHWNGCYINRYKATKRGKQICCHNEALQATGQDEDKQAILLSAPALDIFQSCVYSKKGT